MFSSKPRIVVQMVTYSMNLVLSNSIPSVLPGPEKVVKIMIEGPIMPNAGATKVVVIAFPFFFPFPLSHSVQ